MYLAAPVEYTKYIKLSRHCFFREIHLRFKIFWVKLTLYLDMHHRDNTAKILKLLMKYFGWNSIKIFAKYCCLIKHFHTFLKAPLVYLCKYVTFSS